MSTDPLTTAVKIGISLGSAAVALFIVFFLVFKRKKRLRKRNYRKEKKSLDGIEPVKRFGETQVLQTSDGRSRKEMEVPLDWYRELPGTHKVELLDHSAASGSGRDITELSSPPGFTPFVHELMSRRSPDNASCAQSHAAINNSTIMVSTTMSNESRPSANVSAPVVQTIICSSRAAEVDLERSLPPTPISESVQISPIVCNFERSRLVTGDYSK